MRIGDQTIREEPSTTGYDPAIHHRRSIRLRGHDYAGGGVYFVTLCVANRRPLFGTVVNGRMALNDAGRAAAACWREIPAHFPHAALDEWVVMPDHVHGLLRMGLACHAPTACRAPTAVWQRNYYDIIVRDARALHNIRQYIRDNPAHWDTLRYGEPRFFAGNRALLDLPQTAFLASRTGMACPSRARRIRRALDAGRLLIITPFDDTVRGFSAARAAWCNQYTLHLAANAVVGPLAPDGMLACLLADLRRDLPVRYMEPPVGHGRCKAMIEHTQEDS